MREPTAASHFTRNMFQSLAEKFLPPRYHIFFCHQADIRYI